MQRPCRGEKNRTKQKTFKNETKTREKKAPLTFCFGPVFCHDLAATAHERGDERDSQSQSLFDKIARNTHVERGEDNSIPDTKHRAEHTINTKHNEGKTGYTWNQINR